MNDVAGTKLNAMAARLAATTGAPIDVARQGLRAALAMLAVGMGADPAIVDDYTDRFGFRLRRPLTNTLLCPEGQRGPSNVRFQA